MKWEFLVATLIFALIGYLIGSISNAVLISKIFKKEDIRNSGSKNAGATNSLRKYGFKIGFSVFLLDFCKPILAIVIVYLIKTYSGWYWAHGAMIQITGLATIIGHIFPIFFKFKGGKGVACLGGFVLMLNWLIFVILTIVFLFILYKTKKVSLGSIIMPFAILIMQIVFNFIPKMNSIYFNPIMQDPSWWANSLVIIAIGLLIIWKHSENISRLLKGTERDTNLFKKLKKL